MRDVLPEIRAWSGAGEQLALATVVETWGSSPRPVGSKLVVTASGRMAGSVSNGCVEGAVVEAAQEVLQRGEPRLVAFGVADEQAFEVGLACGGHIEVYIQPLLDQHLELLDLLETDAPAVLRTNLESGAVDLVRAAPDEDRAFRHDGWFVEPFPRPAELVIVGAIHIAIPLHRLAKILGYRVTVIDARSRFATRERFPEADEVVVAWPDEALADRRLDRSTAVVVLTHDPKFDLPALRSVLRRGVGYIGAIGSRKTNANRLNALREEGFTPDEVAQIHGPIGLDLGGGTAEETALAILAEVTAVRHRASGAQLREQAVRA